MEFQKISEDEYLVSLALEDYIGSTFINGLATFGWKTVDLLVPFAQIDASIETNCEEGAWIPTTF